MRAPCSLVLSAIVLSCALSSPHLLAQDDGAPQPPAAEPRVPPPVVPSMQQPVRVAHTYRLADGTPVTLRLAGEIKVKEARVGDTANFVLDHDLWSGDLLVAQAGTPAQAIVVEASKAKWASRGSRLAVDISGLRMVDGQSLRLRGIPAVKGGVGPAARVTGGLAIEAAGLSPGIPSVDYCPVCAILITPVALTSLLAPGSNKNMKAGTLARAWIDGDVSLDITHLAQFQPNTGNTKAKVSVVRGRYGFPYDRSFYCNGVPLAFLPSGRRLDLELQPGYYRFAINPKKDVYEAYLPAGAHAQLITDYDRVYVINEPATGGKLAGLPASIAPDRSVNTMTLKPFARQKTELQYLQSAKPVDPADLYPAECKPLPEAPVEPQD